MNIKTAYTTELIKSIISLFLIISLLFAISGCSGEDQVGPEDTNSGEEETVQDTEQDTDQEIPVCPAGTAGCPCDQGDLCEGDLVCDDGTCIATSTQGLKISDPNARSCELLLQETTGKVLNAGFSEALRGAINRREPYVAIVFFGTSDQAIPDGSIVLQVEGDSQGFLAKSVECFDRLGQPLEGTEITFGE